MPDAAASVAKIDDRNDSYRAIVSDLMSLIEQVQACTRLVESAVASEAPPGNQEVAANIVVLDDVTPRYARVTATLNTCDAGLNIALHFLLGANSLLDAGASKHGTDGSARLRLV
jgi:hypothetical protein